MQGKYYLSGPILLRLRKGNHIGSLFMYFTIVYYSAVSMSTGRKRGGGRKSEWKRRVGGRKKEKGGE